MAVRQPRLAKPRTPAALARPRSAPRRKPLPTVRLRSATTPPLPSPIPRRSALARPPRGSIRWRTNTYTLAGINSAASLAAQTGTLRVVTTDAAGNLASAPLPTDLSGSVATLQSQVTTLQGQVKQAFEGTAIAIALGASTLPGDKRYAVTVNWGNFRGENAMSLAAQYRVTDYVVLNAGVAAGFAQGGVGSRAGVTFAW